MPDYVVFIIVVAVIIVVFILLLYLMAYNISSGYFKMLLSRRSTENSYTCEDENNPWYKRIKEIEEKEKENEKSKTDIEIDSYGFKIHGFMYKKNSQKCVLFYGTLGSNPSKESALLTSYYLKQDISVLVVVPRAHDNSEGKYFTMGLKERFDLISFCTYLKEEGYEEIYLQGLGWGSLVITSALTDVQNDIKGIIIESGIISPYDFLKKDLKRVKYIGGLLFYLFYKKTKKVFKADIKHIDALYALKHSNVRGLFIGAGKDLVYKSEYVCEMSKALEDSTLFIDNVYFAENIYEIEEYEKRITDFINK